MQIQDVNYCRFPYGKPVGTIRGGISDHYAFLSTTKRSPAIPKMSLKPNEHFNDHRLVKFKGIKYASRGLS